MSWQFDNKTAQTKRTSFAHPSVIPASVEKTGAGTCKDDMTRKEQLALSCVFYSEYLGSESKSD